VPPSAAAAASSMPRSPSLINASVSLYPVAKTAPSTSTPQPVAPPDAYWTILTIQLLSPLLRCRSSTAWAHNRLECGDAEIAGDAPPVRPRSSASPTEHAGTPAAEVPVPSIRTEPRHIVADEQIGAVEERSDMW